MVQRTGKVKDKTIDASNLDIPIDGMFRKEKRYALTPLEHRIISQSEATSQDWAKRFWFISMGIFIIIVSKIIVFVFKFETENEINKARLSPDVESWELIYLSIGLLIWLGFWLFSKSKYDKSERKILIHKIKEYYDRD